MIELCGIPLHTPAGNHTSNNDNCHLKQSIVQVTKPFSNVYNYYVTLTQYDDLQVGVNPSLWWNYKNSFIYSFQELSENPA